MPQPDESPEPPTGQQSPKRPPKPNDDVVWQSDDRVNPISMSAKYSDDEPRDDHGRWTDGGSGQVSSSRARLALRTFKPSTAAKQRWAAKNEQSGAKYIGGTLTDDNAPVDVVVKSGRIPHGVEIKTMLDNSNDKVTMHPASLARKEQWAKENKGVLHTIVFDDRNRFGSPGHSGNRLYYKQGVGSYRLQSMTPVSNPAQLRQLMGLRKREFDVVLNALGDTLWVGEHFESKYSDDQPRDDHGRWGSGGGSYHEFEQHALSGLAAMSRTSHGEYDSSASPDKPQLGAEGEALARASTANFKEALKLAWDQKGAAFDTPASVHAFIGQVGETLTKGLVQPGELLRAFDAEHYVPAKEVPAQLQAFSKALQGRFASGADSIDTAAMIEQTFNRIHPWSDSVGRGSRVLAAHALARGGASLPTYPSRDEFYRHIGSSPAEWRTYYRTLFAGAKYSEDQPRDDHGRWGEGGAEVSAEQESFARQHGIDPQALAASEARIRSEASTQAEHKYARELAVADAHASAALATGDTRAQFTKPDGSYTAERQALHDQIARQFFEDHAKEFGRLPPSGLEHPVVTFMAGLPGAGKSTAARDIIGADVVKIDPDTMKSYLPEYNHGAGAAVVARESGDLADRMMAYAAAQRMNIVIDGTLKTSGTANQSTFSDGALGKMAMFKDLGYNVQMRYVDVDIPTSIHRVVNRYVDEFNRTGHGRYVTPNFTRALHDPKYGSAPARTFALAKATSLHGHPVLDAWIHVNGNTGQVVAHHGTLTAEGH